MDLFGPDDWQPHSGYVSLILAEYRLRNLRCVPPLVARIHGEVMPDLHDKQAEYIAAVLGDENASVYEHESREAAAEELAMASAEIPVLLIGSLVTFGLSVLEAALADSAVDAADHSAVRLPRKIRRSKIEGLLSFRSTQCGIQIGWDSELLGTAPLATTPECLRP